MTWIELRNSLRLLLQDETASKWSDTDLDTWLNEAQLTYVKKTGSLRQVMEIYPDASSGEYLYPDNFLEFVYGYNYNNLPIIPSTYNNLAANLGDGFDDIEGDPEYIFDDDADDNSYHLYPTPVVLLDGEDGYSFSSDSEFGIIQTFDDSSGNAITVMGDDYGLIYSYGTGTNYGLTVLDYGITQSSDGFDFDSNFGLIAENLGTVSEWQEWFINSYIFGDIMRASVGEVVNAIYLPGGPIGQMQYVRKPITDTIEVSDTDPLAFYAASLAYSQETAWKDAAYAQALMDEFTRLASKESPVANLKQSKSTFF